MEEGTVWKSRRALFGEDFRETYELLQNRFLFVEGGNDEYLFLEQYVLLGNFMNDPDRFAVFEALLLDFVREIVSDEDDGEELGKARKVHERLLEQARLLRSELARIEREHDEVAARIGEADDRFTQIFRLRGSGNCGGRAGRTRSNCGRKRRRSREKLAELAPEIDAAKQRMEFLADEHKSQLGRLSEPARECAATVRRERRRARRTTWRRKRGNACWRNGFTGWKSGTSSITCWRGTKFAESMASIARPSICSN